METNTQDILYIIISVTILTLACQKKKKKTVAYSLFEIVWKGTQGKAIISELFPSSFWVTRKSPDVQKKWGLL